MDLLRTAHTYITEFDSSRQPIIHDYTWSLPIISVIVYLLFVRYGPKLLGNKTKFDLSLTLRYWNLFLAILSLLMFLGMAPPCFSFFLEKGPKELICLPQGELYHGSQMFWVWLFALSKYIELIDTVFLVLRGRPVSFLHYYHHTTVLLYTWFSMNTLPGGVGYVFSIMNSAVHTIMYWYYYRTACGIKLSWGQVVTVVQLAQMVVGVAIAGLWTYFYLTGTECTCDYAIEYIIGSIVLYGSYYLLFLQFYTNRYFNSRNVAKKTS